MSIDTSKIELGAGNLSIKASGEAIFTDCGAAMDAEANYKVERKEVECAQVPGTVKNPIVGTAAEFKVQVLERSMRNVIIGMGGDPADIIVNAGPPADHEVQMGGSFKSIDCDIKYEVPQVDDRSKTDTFEMWKANAVSGIVLPYKKKGESIFELNFKGLVDSSKSDNLCSIKRED